MGTKVKETVIEYSILTVATIILVIGVYVFKFPNNFSFGGVTGFAVILSKVLHLSASDYTFILNIALLIVGFIFLGRSFGVKTVYVSLLTSFGLSFMERAFPMSAPLTNEPVLELMFAIFLPALSAAIFFNVGASGGGTDIIARIFQLQYGISSGKVLLSCDAIVLFISLSYLDIKHMMYTLLASFILARVMDTVQHGA